MEENNNPLQEISPVNSSNTIQNNPPAQKPFVKKSMLIILGVIIGIIALLIGSFFVLNSYIRNEELKPNIPTPTEGPIYNPQANLPLPTPSNTAEWITYYNDPFGFSIKFPKEYKKTRDTTEHRTLLPKNIVVDISTVEFTRNGNTLTFQLEENPNFKDDQAYIEFFKKYYDPFPSLIVVDNIKTVFSSGKVAEDGRPEDLPFHAVAYFANNGKTYSVEIMNKSSVQDLEQQLKDILSTFKFKDGLSLTPTISDTKEPKVCQTDADCMPDETCTLVGPVTEANPQSTCWKKNEPHPL